MYYTNLEHFKELSGYEIDGIWYPRVTKIVEIKAKPALYKFYAELNSFEEGELIKEKAASEGTLIHEAAEKILSVNRRKLIRLSPRQLRHLENSLK